VVSARGRRIGVASQRTWFATLLPAVLVVVLLASWIALAPTRLAGQVSYVIVVGNSMEPRLHRGDLAIVRAAQSYETGDVVTYLHPEIGPVIHRIVGRDGDRFVFKGDNNSWLDPYQPTQSELLGTLWFDVPSAGGLMALLRAPWMLALLAGALAAMAIAPALRVPTLRSKTQSMNVPTKLDKETGQTILSALAASALAFALLTFYAFSQPLQRSVSDDTPYQHSGVFSYSAAVPAGSVYEAGVVEPGQPVFRRLANVVNVALDYRLEADRPYEIEGSHRLVAVVSDVNGWKRSLPLQSDTAFDGPIATARGTLNLNELQALTDAMQAEAGVQRQDFMVTVSADVTVNGTLAGQELRDQFAPRMTFRMDAVQLQLLAGTRDPDADPLRPAQAGLLKGSRVEPNFLPLLALRLDVDSARALGIGGLALSGLAMLAVGLLLQQALQGDEPTRIQARYGTLLLSVMSVDGLGTQRVVDVASIDDLARLAERGGRMILHSVNGLAHSYVVQEADGAYRYCTEARLVADARAAQGEGVPA
jgi:signal peptidase